MNITSDPLTQLLMEVFGIVHGGQDNPNVAPTEPVRVVRADGDGDGYRSDALRWWLTPSWSREMSTRYAMFNAKSETLRSSRAFARPFARRRCVVPISGFYEWTKQDGQKLPYYITALDADGLLLAGLWDSWIDRGQDASATPVETFTVITTAVQPQLEFVHKRQPVLLTGSQARHWLDAEADLDDLAELFVQGLPQSLAVVPVSTHVNNARHKDLRCVQAIGTTIEVHPQHDTD